MLSLGPMPHVGHLSPRTEYGSKFGSSNRHVLYRHMQYTLMIDSLVKRALMLDKYNRLTGLLIPCYLILVATCTATIECPAS